MSGRERAYEYTRGAFEQLEVLGGHAPVATRSIILEKLIRAAARCAGAERWCDALVYDLEQAAVCVAPAVLPSDSRKRALYSLPDVPQEIAAAPEMIGWCYQIWNEPMRALHSWAVSRKEQEQNESADIGVLTQLFTDDYLADFLIDRCVRLCRPENRTGAPTLTLCDPACGTGHILLAAVKRLSRGEDSFECIEDALFGFDIDPVAVALARALVFLQLIAGGYSRDSEKLIQKLRRSIIALPAPFGTLLRSISNQQQQMSFDVVVTNPPYLGRRKLSSEMRRFLDREYPATKIDLCAAFMQRCIELCKARGAVGLLTSDKWLRLRGYETLRTGHDNFKGLLGELSLDVVLELGARAFHPSVALHDGVKATILCAQKESAQPGHVFFYQNLATEDSYDAKVAVLRDAARADLGVPIVQSKWQESGTSAMLLGASDLPLSLRRATTTVAQRADVVVGIQTSDDARYVKYVWQIPAGQSGWRIHSKGGGYARWYGLNRWVIDWERGSREFFKTDNARIVAEQWADKEGWSYTWFANGALGVRAKAAGWTFGRAAASGVFSEDTRVIAFLNSRFASVASQAIGGKVQLPEGIVRALPMPQTLAAISPELVSLARIIKRDLTRSDMREADYDPALLRDPWQELWLEALVLVIEGILERQVERCLEMTTETSEQWGNVHGYPVAWLTPSAEVLSHPFWGLMSTDVEDYRTVLQRDTESMPESGRAQLFSSFKICMLKQGATGYPRRYVMPSTGIVEHLARLHQAHPFDVVCAIRDGIEESSPAVRDIGSAHLCARITAEILRCLGHRWWNAAETTPRETVLKLNCGDLSSIVERCIEHPFQRQLLGPCVSTWIKRVLIPWQNKRFFGASPLSYREIAGKEFYCERMSFVPEAERDEKAVGLG